MYPGHRFLDPLPISERSERVPTQQEMESLLEQVGLPTCWYSNPAKWKAVKELVSQLPPVHGEDPSIDTELDLPLNLPFPLVSPVSTPGCSTLGESWDDPLSPTTPLFQGCRDGPQVARASGEPPAARIHSMTQDVLLQETLMGKDKPPLEFALALEFFGVHEDRTGLPLDVRVGILPRRWKRLYALNCRNGMSQSESILGAELCNAAITAYRRKCAFERRRLCLELFASDSRKPPLRPESSEGILEAIQAMKVYLGNVTVDWEKVIRAAASWVAGIAIFVARVKAGSPLGVAEVVGFASLASLFVVTTLEAFGVSCSLSALLKSCPDQLLAADPTGAEALVAESGDVASVILKVCTSAVCLVATGLGFSPVQASNWMRSVNTSAITLQDSLDCVLHMMFGLDVFGKRKLEMLINEVGAITRKFLELSLDLFTVEKRLELKEHIRLLEKLAMTPGEKTSLLVADVQKLTALLASVNKVFASKMDFPCPCAVYIWGQPGVGKSEFVRTWTRSLSAKLKGPPRHFNLSSGDFSLPFAGETVAFWDEFGVSASTTGMASRVESCINSICSGEATILPTANLDGKEQTVHFSSVILASNVKPTASTMRLSKEAFDAFRTRCYFVEFIDDKVEAISKGRNSYPHRKADFSHLSVEVTGPGFTKSMNGRQFMDFMFADILEKQRQFAQRTECATVDLQPEAVRSSTCWLVGSPNIGKTFTVRQVERIISNTTKHKFFYPRSYTEAVPADATVLVLDDVVDPTTIEGQRAYSKYWDENVFPQKRLLIVCSNYAPRTMWTDWVMKEKGIEPCTVLCPSFARRAGWDTCSGGILVRAKTVSQASTNWDGLFSPSRPISDCLVKWFIGQQSSGVIIETVDDPKVGFTRDASDLWLVTDAETPSQILAALRPSARLATHTRKIVSLASVISVAQALPIFQEIVDAIPDIKVYLRNPAGTLVIDGSRMQVGKSLESPSEGVHAENGFVFHYAGSTVNISHDDFIALDWGEHKLGPKSNLLLLSLFDSMSTEMRSRCRAAVPLSQRVGYAMGRIPVRIFEFLKANSKGCILLAMAVGIFSLVRRFFSGGTRATPVKDTRPEDRRRNVKVVYAGDGTSFAVCSEPDESGRHDRKRDLKDAVEVRDNYEEYVDDLSDRMAHGSEPLDYHHEVDKFMKSKGFKRSTATPEACKGPAGFGSPALDSFSRALDQNRVGTPGCYALMLSQSVGVLPLHCLKAKTVSWRERLPGSDTTIEKRFSLDPFLELPEQELAFFVLRDDMRRIVKGPFRSLAQYIVPHDTVENVKDAFLVVQDTDGTRSTHIQGKYHLETVPDNGTSPHFFRWTKDAGFFDYARLSLPANPTVEGSCGLPVYTCVGGAPALIGVHSASIHSCQQLISAVITQEVWELARSALSRLVQPEFGDDATEVYPFHNLVRHVSQEEIDLREGSTGGDLLVVSGPSLANLGTIRNSIPYDTKASRFATGLNLPTDWESKVPTLSADSILKCYPHLVARDASGRPHPVYTRLSAAEENKESVSLDAFATQLANTYVELEGLDADGLAPLSLRSAVLGNRHVKPLERHTSAGSFVQMVLGVSEKCQVVDYDLETSSVTWSPKGLQVHRMAMNQWMAFKKGTWLSYPNAVGLKSELLPADKLHRKRVFVIVSLPSLLNQKRLLSPIRVILDRGPRSRFIFSFDPVADSDHLFRSAAQFGNLCAPFDASSFDFTVPFEVIRAVGEFCRVLYGGRHGTTLRTAMHEYACAPLIVGNSLIAKRGGVASGGCETSMVDGVANMLMLFYVIIQRTGLTLPQAFRLYGTKHCGDDLLVTTNVEGAKLITPEQIRIDFLEIFGVKLTFGKGVDGPLSWRGLEFAEFCSKTFVPHPKDNSIFIPKLKLISVVGALRWTGATEDFQVKEQLKEALLLSYPHGSNIFVPARRAVVQWCEERGFNPRDIPTEDEVAEIYRVKTKLSPGIIEIPASVLRSPPFERTKNLEIPSLEVTMTKELKAARKELGLALNVIEDANALRGHPSVSKFGEVSSGAVKGFTLQHSTEASGTMPGLMPNSDLAWRWILGTNLSPQQAEFCDELTRAWEAHQEPTRSPVRLEKERFLKKVYTSPLDLTIDEIRNFMHVCSPGGPAAEMDSAAQAPASTPVKELKPTASVAHQDYAADSNAVVTTMEPVPLVTGGSGTRAAVVMETLGGMDTLLISRGSFMNSILAPVLDPAPILTIDVGTTTAEGTILYQERFDPWNAAFVGPWVQVWANLHSRFAGSIELTLEVASAATIVGKIALYYIPTGVSLKNPTRTKLHAFEHVIVDLYSPSAQKLVVRPSSSSKFYMEYADREADWGQVVVMAYTSISNTFGANVSPPVILNAALGPDAIFSLPSFITTPDTSTETNVPLPPVPDPTLRLLIDGADPVFDPSLVQVFENFVDPVTIKTGPTGNASTYLFHGTHPLEVPTSVWILPKASEYSFDTLGHTIVGKINDISSFDIYRPTHPTDTPFENDSTISYNGAVAVQVLDSVVTHPFLVDQNGNNLVKMEVSPRAAIGSYTILSNASSAKAKQFFTQAYRLDGVVFRIVPGTQKGAQVYVSPNITLNLTPSGAPIANKASFYRRPVAPTEGVPPGFQTVILDDGKFFGGVPASLPRLVGNTVPPNKATIDYAKACKTYCERNGLKRFVLRGQSADGSAVVHLLCSPRGIFVYGAHPLSWMTRFLDSFTWFFHSKNSDKVFAPLPEAPSFLFLPREVAQPEGLFDTIFTGFNEQALQNGRIEAAQALQQNAINNSQALAQINSQTGKTIAAISGLAQVRAAEYGLKSAEAAAHSRVEAQRVASRSSLVAKQMSNYGGYASTGLASTR